MPDIEQQNSDHDRRPRVLRRMIAAPEGKVLLVGAAMFLLYFSAILVARTRWLEAAHSVLRMTGAHVFSGRAAGMTSGYAEHLPNWLVIVANMTIETFIVLLCYPLFVLSYNKLVIIKPLEESMARIRKAAMSHQARIMKFGIPGLLLFVWFPFWMTGPVVGAIIGFLIGLRPLVNLTVVLCGTYVAILCWAWLLRRVHDALASVSPYVPVVFVGFIFLVAISIHIRYAFLRQANSHKNHEQD